MSSNASPRAPVTSERNKATPTLPSKYRIPPLPPHIHRRIYLKPLQDGLLLGSSASSSNAGVGRDNDVWIGYGPKGQIKRWRDLDAQRKQRPFVETVKEDPVVSLEIGGILGLTRLWETAYLLVFLSPPRTASNGPQTTTTSTGTGTGSGVIRIFPPEVKNEFPNLPLNTPSRVEESDPLIRGLRAIAEREGLLSPDGRLNAYSPRGTQMNADEEESSVDEDKREGQGMVYELRNVYAIPINREGAEGIIRNIHAATVKNKPRTTPASGATQPMQNQVPQTDSMTSSRASLDTEPETPAQALARALNPARWNLGINKKVESTVAVSSEVEGGPKNAGKVSKQQTGVKTDSVQGRTGSDPPADSGDIGESMFQEDAEASVQKADKASGEAHYDDQAGLPKPDDVMAKVSETRTKEEASVATSAKRSSFMDGLKADWNKMFGVKPAAKAGSNQGSLVEGDSDEEARDHTVDAQLPGVLDGARETGGAVEVEDGEVKQETEDTLPTSTATTGQRKDLEVKIIREIVRTLGGGGFFYSFETDLSHNLQHKRKQLDVRKQSTGLLGSLLQKGDGDRSPLPLGSEPTTPGGDLADSMLGQPAVGGSGHGLEAPAEITEKDHLSLDRERQERGETWIEPDVGLPLWRRVDQRFMWNAWMMREFIEAGLHEFILPVIQGWVQSSRFYIPPVDISPLTDSKNDVKSPERNAERDLGPPSTPVDLVLISRRSRDRAGLRFQRRGIDEDGNVANFVETEMIVRVKVEGKWSIFSFVEIRGSIPLFWSQSSTLTDMKPAPKLDRAVAQTIPTTRLHFDQLKQTYGPQTIINLAETSGKEGAVTLGYRDAVQELDDPDVRYKEFDFHHECKGMKYENISKLITQLGATFGEQGYFWSCQGEVMREQTGTFRVNCIDCLDRTNVVESALARHVLTSQLTQVGMTPDALTSNIEFVYNDAWANNGDQISKLYAGTSALKGDFTRTGKRDLHGMINDGLNSVARMRRGAIEDFYLQAVISFMVGERNLNVFSEVLSNLASNDRTNLIRLSRIRAAAIETCTARVLEEGEHRIGGWTVFSPEEANTKFTRKLEEKVLVLTHQALYVVSFDYNLEKVVSSTRVPLRNVTSMSKGAYILSALDESGRDPAENAGFVVYYRPAKTGTRVTSYSMVNSPDPKRREMASSDVSPRDRTDSAGSDAISTTSNTVSSSNEFFAFKILPREFVAAHLSGSLHEEDQEEDRGKDDTCKTVADRMVKRIRDECVKATASIGGYVGGHARDEGFVRDEDVVGLAEAQKATSLVARADYALKRFLWIP